MSAVVIKLSGAAFSDGRPLDGFVFEAVAAQILELRGRGFRIGVVTGGGNIYRGTEGWGRAGLHNGAGHELGMLATALNAQALAYQLRTMSDVGVRVIAKAGVASAVGAPWCSAQLRTTTDVVIVAGGTGQPGVSSDVAAPLLARDMGAKLVIVSKHNVDGVYTADPNAAVPRGVAPRFLPRLTVDDALEMHLRFMDREALVLCKDFGIDLRVVSATEEHAILRASGEEEIGSFVFSGGLTEGLEARRAEHGQVEHPAC